MFFYIIHYTVTHFTIATASWCAGHNGTVSALSTFTSSYTFARCHYSILIRGVFCSNHLEFGAVQHNPRDL